jgi:hypothetical protein
MEPDYMMPVKLHSETRASEAAHKIEPTGFSRVDAMILVAFALFSLANFMGRWKGITPFVFLGSDAGIVTSFVAAYDNPDLFRHDVLLGNYSNFRYYLAIHPFLIHYLKELIGDYGTAYIVLLPFTTFMQAAGFYLLGRLLFANRYWATLLSIITLCPLALPVREFWGIYDDPLPRSLFHAFLPFLLAGAFHFKSRPKMWPVLMACVGLAFYSHPVSVPCWAFAFWLGMFMFLPPHWSLWKQVLYMGITGGVFVLVVLPWVANFALVHDRAACEGITYGDVVGIIANRVGPELLSVKLAVGLWWERLQRWPLNLYFAGSVAGAAGIAWLNPAKRRDLALLGVWVIGILFVSVGLTYAEEVVCTGYGLRRLQMDSIRGIKYLVPLMLLLCVWGLAEVSARGPSRSLTRMIATFCGALVVGTWVYMFPPVYFFDTIRSWASGSFLPPVSQIESDTTEALKAISVKTEPGARILPLALPLEIRYFALRPVSYAYKDGGIFADTNLQALLEWEAIRKLIADLGASQGDQATRIAKLLAISKATKSSYILTDFLLEPNSVGANTVVIWSNSSYTLLKVSEANALHQSHSLEPAHYGNRAFH